MKISFIAAHQKVGPLCKSMGLADGTNRTYPNAKQITSFEEKVEVSAEGLKDYREHLVSHATQGHAFYKGNFTRPLVNESRRGLTDKDQKTQLLILDIDGLPFDGFTKGKKTAKDVKATAEAIINVLPKELHTVSYVAAASSSFGTKDRRVGMHIHMLLDEAVDTPALKDWLTSLNYTQIALYEKLELSGAKQGIHYLVDPCLADATRIVYIAPPHFGPKATNPFESVEDRFVLVEKAQSTLDLKAQIDLLDKKAGLVNEQRETKLAELFKLAGIRQIKTKKKRLQIAGQETSVVTNPYEIRMSLAYDDDEFIRYNVGNGSSGAYWVRRDNPEVVFCFKPGVQPFLFKEADPAAYDAHIRRFGGAFEAKVVDGKRRELQYSLFIDRPTDAYYTMVFDRKAKEVVELQAQALETAKHYLNEKGALLPDPIPSAYIVTEPATNEALFERDGKRIVNQFVPTEYIASTDQHYMVDEKGISRIGYADAWLLFLDCPHIASTIYHMLGDDDECFNHFINWLAFIFQRKTKAKTAWMVHGEQGTGKGLVFSRLIRALFGERYTKQTTLESLVDDKFNDWLAHCLFLMVDEFNMNSTQKVVKTANTLKNMITESTYQMRAMRVSNVETKQMLNFLLGTNDYDALAMNDKRRINVAPRQERMLPTRFSVEQFDDDGEVVLTGLRSPMKALAEFDKAFDDEIAMFATYLRCVKVNEEKVVTTLSNVAKEATTAAGMTSVDRFFNDINHGNFAAFADILDTPEAGLSQDELLMLKNAKNVLRRCVNEVNTGLPCMVRIDDFRALYMWMAGKKVSQNAFGRMIATHGLGEKKKKTRSAVGMVDKTASGVWAIEVQWGHNCPATVDRIKEMHLSMDNVKTFPDEPPHSAGEDSTPTKPASSW